MGDIDPQELPGELAAGQGEATVGAEVHVVHALAGDVHRVTQAHGVRVAEVKPLQRFGDDDGKATIGGEVHVVGIGHRHRGPRTPAARIDRRQRVAVVVGGP